MRLIDADALISALVKDCNNDQTKTLPVWIEKQIDAQTTQETELCDRCGRIRLKSSKEGSVK